MNDTSTQKLFPAEVDSHQHIAVDTVNVLNTGILNTIQHNSKKLHTIRSQYQLQNPGPAMATIHCKAHLEYSI